MADKEKKPSKLAEKWEGLSSKAKQQIILFGVIFGVGFVAFIGLNSGGPSTRAVDPAQIDAEVSNRLLPDQNTREIGMSGMSQDVEAVRGNLHTLTEQMQAMDEYRKQQQQNALNSGGDRTREQLRIELDEIKQQLEALRINGIQAQAQPQGSAPASVDGGPAAPTYVPASEIANGAYGGIRSIRTEGAQASGTADLGDMDSDSPNAAPDYSDDGSGDKEGRRRGPAQSYIPSGSIIRGVMLTGLDAPTGKGAMKDPVPVLVRIQHEAILPNRYRADVKECFALVAGQGDLAAERAYLRSESISCVRKDKSVIDLSMNAYVVDTDGKAGLRGRLVSKQGAVISKAILASFADGVSQAFKGNSPPLNFGSGDGVDYGSAGQAGVVMGVSSSLDRISKYYLDLADQLFPILEIDAGREVTLVLVKGMEVTTVN